MQKLITPRKLASFLTIVYSISLIPLLWIGWYNYPSADDFVIGNEYHQAWVTTHNLFAALWAGAVHAVGDWIGWMGYFTSDFLMAVPPSSLNERLAVLTPWIMLGMLTFSTCFLLKVIFVKVFCGDKYISRCVAMLMLFVTVQCMVGRVEAFYWYSGAVNYMFVHGMSLFFYGLLICAAHDEGKKRVWDLAWASFLGFFVGGGNQMTALNVFIILSVVIGFLAHLKKWKEYRALIIPIVLFYVGFLLNVASPGNWVRAADVAGMNPVKAVMVSFYYCVDYCLSEWSGWPVTILVIALIPLFFHMAGETDFQFRFPLVVVLFGYCIVSAMMTPPLFAVGNMEAERLQALTFTMYILVLTLCVGYVVGWVRKKWDAQSAGTLKKQMSVETENRFSIPAIQCLIGCILFFGFAGMISIIPESHYFTFSSALTDLGNGSAQAYGQALEERTELYKSGEKNIVVEQLPAQPVLLYFSDIKKDPEDWENKGVCRFYGLESVKMRE